MQLAGRIRSARRRRVDGERGVVLVETALLLPIILALIFGIIEFSFAFQSSAQLTHSVRSSARSGSVLAGESTYAETTAQAAGSALLNMTNTTPVELWIYEANSQGFPLPEGNTSFTYAGPGAHTCVESCIRYVWEDSAFNTSAPTGAGWAAATHQNCVEPFDQIGVYVTAEYTFMTGFFWDRQTITDHAVFRFEPRPANECA